MTPQDEVINKAMNAIKILATIVQDKQTDYRTLGISAAANWRHTLDRCAELTKTIYELECKLQQTCPPIAGGAK